MSFWTYMLHCRGGYFYVGHTDDLERRIGDHKSGLIPGFTADHQPVELVWSDQFASREDAKAAERKLKGWSRAKKLALIRGDWDRISALAKKKDSASTSSAWTGKEATESPKPLHPEAAETLYLPLHPHPATPPKNIRGIQIYTDARVISFYIDGPPPRIPPDAPRVRSDGLWKTTCFEMFIKSASGPNYYEFNFSPSGQWAAYAFDSYRTGMHNLPLATAPIIEPIEDGIRVTVEVPPLSSRELLLNIAAVIEETDGTKSYWALAHPPGKPDFHHPTCFAATLPAPEKP